MNVTNQGNIPLFPPNLSNQINQTGQQVVQGSQNFTSDQLVQSMEQKVTQAQAYVNHIDPSQPNLIPKGNDNIEANNNIQIKGNPWLAANPLATFTICFLELSYVLAQLKLREAELGAQTILAMTALTGDIAQLIKDIGEAEAIGHFVSAGMALGSAVTNLVGGGLARSGNPNAGQIQSKMAQVTGFASLFNVGDEIAKGIITLQKSTMEATKTFAENEKQLLQDQLGKAADAYKTAEGMLDQILQTLVKLYDESYRAHGWQTH